MLFLEKTSQEPTQQWDKTLVAASQYSGTKARVKSLCQTQVYDPLPLLPPPFLPPTNFEKEALPHPVVKQWLIQKQIVAKSLTSETS